MEEPARSEVAEAEERILLEQGRRAELLVAYVRAAGWAVTLAMGELSRFWPSLGVAMPKRADALGRMLDLLVYDVVAGSIALVVLLRRGWYKPWMRVATPLLDAAAYFAMSELLRVAIGPEFFLRAGVLTVISTSCTVIALTGLLRGSTDAAVASTAAGVALFVAIASRAGQTAGVFAAQVITLAVLGGLGIGVAGAVRRALRSEIGRATLSRFLPQQVVESAYADPKALLASPRNAEGTVVVTDVRGFTAWAETRPPAEVFDFLNQLQGRLAEVVRARGGTVDKFLGDGMLAVFGVPEESPDHAARAVQAAREMLGAIAELRFPGTNLAVQLGIGVNSGALAVGCVGSGARLEFTILGDTVNTAARLQDMTKSHKVAVLLTEETVQRCGGGDSFKQLGEADVRGRRGAVRLFTVT
jgi:adenylate cyclase